MNEVQSSSSDKWVLFLIVSLSVLSDVDALRQFTNSCSSEAHSSFRQLLAPSYVYGAVMYVRNDSVSFGVKERFCDGCLFLVL